MRSRRVIRTSLKWLLIALVLGVALLPTYLIVLTALRPPAEVSRGDNPLWTGNPTFDNFTALFAETDFAQQMLNSLIAACLTTVLAVAISTLAALGLSRLKFRGRDGISGAVFLTYLFPGSLLFIPIFITLSGFGMANSRSGLIFAYLSFTVPFVTWMLRGYLISIPKELEEAARIDGCGQLRALLLVVLPLALPGLAAAAVFSFTLAINDYLFAFILTTNPELYTVPLGMAYFMHTDSVHWGRMMSAAVLYSLPALVLYIAAQRFLVGGLTAGATKG